MAANSGSTLKQVQAQARGFSLKVLQAFHSIDRHLYRRLLLRLGLGPYRSKKIFAFWFLLERIGGFRNFVKNTEKLSDTLLLELVREAVKCLNFLYRPGPSNPEIGVLPFTCIFVGLDGISLELLICLNRAKILKETDNFMNNLGIRIFGDIDGEFIRTKEYAAAEMEIQAAASSDSQIERTLFVTFSKGHPLTREQLLEFFTGKYGANCIEAIHIPSHPCLYARVTVQSTSYVTAILGENELVQSSIHGKDIRMRRFISKSSE